MEKLVDLGLAKSIGVSNFNSQQLERLLANCRIKPVANQVGGSFFRLLGGKLVPQEWFDEIVSIFFSNFSIGRSVTANQPEEIDQIL